MTFIKPKILLDVDGILTDFHAAVAHIATMAGSPILVQRMSTWEMSAALRSAGASDEIVDMCLNAMASEGFNSKLSPCGNALKYLPKLQEIANVTFITSPNVKCITWIDERIEWMVDNFNINPASIIFSCNKHTIPGDVFVDDNPLNVINWKNHQSGLSLLWDAPYNRDVMVTHRIRSWPELIGVTRLIVSKSS